ncbi:Uncharacterised protein [uncultured archaeon]|nr:Uncharacterised protein [uncultured archaeon]
MGNIPVVVLAGSNARFSQTQKVHGEGTLEGVYKGAEVSFLGRPLILQLIRVLEESGCFSDVLVAGPRRVYGGLVGSEIIDVDGSVGSNIRGVCDFMSGRYGEQSPFALIYYDVMPKVDEIKAYMDAVGPFLGCGLVIGVVDADLVSFDKRGYRIIMEGVVRDFCHSNLLVFKPGALDIELIGDIFDAVYPRRTMGLRGNAWKMTPALLKRVFRVSFSEGVSGVIKAHSILRRYERAGVGVSELEGLLTALLVKQEYRSKSGVHIEPGPYPSLVEDMDTVERLKLIEKARSKETVFDN